MTFISLVLARLLPSDFGAIAILLVFVQISMFFTERFNTALVQAKEVDDDDSRRSPAEPHMPVYSICFGFLNRHSLLYELI